MIKCLEPPRKTHRFCSSRTVNSNQTTTSSDASDDGVRCEGTIEVHNTDYTTIKGLMEVQDAKNPWVPVTGCLDSSS